MKDRGEFYLVVGSSGDYSSYELHPVNCFTSLEEANQCKSDCEDQSLLLKEMIRILESFGYTTLINKNGSELTYSPRLFIISDLVTTIDNEGSTDTEYEVITLPKAKDDIEFSLNQLVEKLEYMSSLLNKESGEKLINGLFEKKGTPNQKLRLL